MEAAGDRVGVQQGRGKVEPTLQRFLSVHACRGSHDTIKHALLPAIKNGKQTTNTKTTTWVQDPILQSSAQKSMPIV